METTNVNKTTDPSERQDIKSSSLFRDEKILKIVALIFLIVGVIATIILIFTLAIDTVQQGYYDVDGYMLPGTSYTERVFNPSGLGIALATLFSSVAMWAFLNVISNISTSLKEMKWKMLM